MDFQDISIPPEIIHFFKNQHELLVSSNRANSKIEEISGIKNFFINDFQINELVNIIDKSALVLRESDRREYGDFQTNYELAYNSVKYIQSKRKDFEFILEPTCGRGTFILAALSVFSNVKKIVGIEIYEPYIWETKFRILNFFLSNKTKFKPEIEIIHNNVFEYDFEQLSEETFNISTLIIGNPPWVTNSELGSIKSKNIPKKSNFKNHKGFDAITGKGNFDIAEYITLLILRNFNKHDGVFGFLIKNSVIKNILFDQKKYVFPINEIERLNIDSKKEFNVSVEASLFVAMLNRIPSLSCKEFDFYKKDFKTEFGWYSNNFVFSLSEYKKACDIEGKSIFVWRQGLKHDCSKIMEFEKIQEGYRNSLNEVMELEDDLVFPLFKSSDLKNKDESVHRKSTIVTQKKIGQETSYIEKLFPLTFDYLNRHREYFDKRKSSIYKGKAPFSIFGIGEYSFAPYKVAISGMYKTTKFTLLKPIENKPVMLDDTCYFIGFDNFYHAKIAHFLLNNEHTQMYLKSIVFPDSKRSITKDLLMRLDFNKIFTLFKFEYIQSNIVDINKEQWDAFGNLINEKIDSFQLSLF